jgi:DNA-binding transcriptional MerR regulator/effector-binding domain-containing protein
LLSIKEFAEYTGVKQHILRHYDDIGVFSPVERGANGYRYYSPQQITALNMVNVYLGVKAMHREIGEFNQNRSPQSTLDFLRQQGRKIDAELSRLHDAYAILHLYESLISEGLTADEDQLLLRECPELPLFLGPVNQFATDGQFYSDFIDFCRTARSGGINLSYPIGGLYQDIDSFTAAPDQPTRFFSTSPHGSQTKPAGRYLVGYARGYYGALQGLPQRLSQYAAEQGLRLDGPVYVLYVLDEVSVADPNQFLAQASVRVQKLPKTAGTDGRGSR